LRHAARLVDVDEKTGPLVAFVGVIQRSGGGNHSQDDEREDDGASEPEQQRRHGEKPGGRAPPIRPQSRSSSIRRRVTKGKNVLRCIVDALRSALTDCQ
jgi:hypothetical protein